MKQDLLITWPICMLKKFIKMIFKKWTSKLCGPYSKYGGIRPFYAVGRCHQIWVIHLNFCLRAEMPGWRLFTRVPVVSILHLWSVKTVLWPNSVLYLALVRQIKKLLNLGFGSVVQWENGYGGICQSSNPVWIFFSFFKNV